MRQTTTIRSWGALLLAAFFAVVTARTLFDDVWGGAPVTTGHLQSLAAIIGAIASGHLLVPMFKQAKIATLIGMAIIFTASTGYVVISAGARNAETSAAKTIAAQNTNANHQAALEKLEDAETDLKAARETARKSAAAAAKECATGKAKKCEGREATRDFDAKQAEKAESHVLMMQARVSVTKPVADPHAGYSHAATVLAALPFVTTDAADIERRLELILPFATVLISEIGVLVFGSLALGHRNVPGPAQPENTAPETSAQVRNSKSGNRDQPARTRGKAGRPSNPEILAFVRDFRTNHSRTPSGSEIKARFPDCPRSTAFDIAARARRPHLKVVA